MIIPKYRDYIKWDQSSYMAVYSTSYKPKELNQEGEWTKPDGEGKRKTKQIHHHPGDRVYSFHPLTFLSFLYERI